MPFSPPSPDTLIEDQPQASFQPPPPDSLILPTNALGENVEDLKSAMARVRRERVGGDIAEGAAKAGEFLTRGVANMFPTAALGQAAEAVGLQPVIPKEHVLQMLHASQNLLPRAEAPDAPVLGNLSPDEARAVAQGAEESAAEQVSGMTRPDALALLAAGAKAPLPVARTFQISPFVSFPGAVQNVEQASARGDIAGTSKALTDLSAQVALPAMIEHGIPALRPDLTIPDFRGADLNTPAGAIPPRPRKVYEQPDATAPAPAAPVEPANVVFGKPEVPFTPPEPQRDIPYVREIRQAGAKTKEEIRKLYPQISREDAARIRDEAWPEDALARKQKEAAIPPLNERIDNALQRETAEAIPPLRERPVESVQQVPAESPGAEAGQRGGTPEEKGKVTPEHPSAADFVDMKPADVVKWIKANRYGPEGTTDKGATTATDVVKNFSQDDLASLSEEMARLDDATKDARDAVEKKYDEAKTHLREATTDAHNDIQAKRVAKEKADVAMKEADALQMNASTLSLKRQTLKEFVDAANARPTPAPEAAAAPKAPEVNFGIWPESEWSAASLAKQTPGERIGKAKFLGLRDKEGQLILGPKTLADAAAKRIQQIKADLAKPKPAPAPEPAAEPAPEPVSIPAASDEVAKTDIPPEVPKQTLPKVGEPLLDVKPSTRKSLQTLRSQIVKRLEELTDIDPVTGKMVEKEEVPDNAYQYGHVKRLQEKLKEVETKLMHGEDVVSAAAAKREAAAPAKPAAAPEGPGSEASPIEVSKEVFGDKGSIMEAYSADKFPKIRKPFSHNGKFYTIAGIEGGPASKAWGHELTPVPTETPVATKRVWTPENRDKGYEGDVVQYQGKKYRLGPRQYFSATKGEIAETKPAIPETKPAVSETPAPKVAENMTMAEIKRKLPIGYDENSVRIEDGRIVARAKRDGKEWFVSLKKAEAEPYEPEAATKAAEPATKAPASPSKSNQPADIQALRDKVKALSAKRDEAVDRWHKRLNEPIGSPEELKKRTDDAKALEKEAKDIQHEMATVQDKLFDYDWKVETAPFRGKPPEKPSPPAITSKVLKAQRENLLEQVDEALKEAPEEGAEKIKIAVPGDGEFTIRNTKSSLKAFRDHAAKEFPATVGGINQPGVKSGKPSTIPKVEDPAVTDLPKIAGKFVSDDPTRQGITGSYADGTQVVATNGRQLIRIWTDKAPGSPIKPVRFNAEGKPVEIEGKMANYQAVRSDKPELLKGGVSTDDLFKLAAQAKIFAKEEKGMTSMKLLVNKDGTIGARMALNNGDLFEHNVKPDALNLGNFNPQYIMDQAEAARRLGNEKVDLYAHSGDGGPIGFVGKNHEGLLMPMRLAEEKTFRDEAKAFDSVAGKKSHPSPVTGLGPIADPDAYIRRDTPNSGYIVLLENGKIRLEQLGPGGNPRKVGTELPIEKFGTTGNAQNASIKQMLAGIPHNAAAVSEIRVAANDALEARGEAVKAVEARREAEIKRNALRLHIIPPVPDWLANIAKSAGRALYRARKAFPTIVDSRQARHWMDQSRDAADNLADIAAQQMGKRIKTGHTDIEDRAASAMIAGKFDPAEFPGLIAKAIRGGNLEARQALEYALGHWSEVEPMARAGEKIFENQLADENSAGINTEYHEGYLPGVYDEDLWMGAGRPFVIGGRSSGGVSTGFKKGKTYATPYDAISDGYVPKTLKLSDLVENRVKRGQRLINRKDWANALRSIVDPTDHKPIVEDLQYVSRGPGLPGFEKAPIGYVAREIIPGTRIAVRENYAKLFDALTGRSAISEFEPGGIPVGTMALEGAGLIKHGLLAFDSFHASRILQKELFLTGKVGYRKGQSLLEYADADLAAAVRAGDIKQEWADWARANRPTANLLIKAGFNVGRIQEGMYNSVIRDVPVIGSFNKWVFEKMTRGAMLQSGLLEFERVRNANPGWSDEQVAAKVARDLNKYFGNLGRQGVFKSPTFQDAARLVALAPNWVESMARSELGGAKQLTYDPIMNRSLHIGSLGKGLAQGLAAYFVGTQLLNLATRGHLTWQNPEEGHKWDAWVPDLAGRSGGYFLSPMGVVAELTHDMIKYSKTEPNLFAAAWRIMRNRSSPYFRAGRILFGGRDWDDSKINDWFERVKKAGIAVLPTPIPLQTVGKTVKPGQVQRQVVSSLGFKLDAAETPRVQIMNQGRAWALNNADPKIKAAAEREQTGDRSDSVYKPLRLALSKNDRQGIIDEVRAIVQLEPKERQAERLKEVLKNVDPFSSNGIKPFATPIHSKAAEVAFVKSMNGNQKAAYKQAVKDAVRDYRKLTEAIYGKPRNPPDVPEAYKDLLK